MTSPLEGKIATAVGKAFASTFYDATVNRTVTADPDPSTPWIPGTATTTTYACKGIVDSYSDYAIANSLVDAQDRKVLILATSLSITPTDLDTITIRGVTYTVINVKTDPALAVWECQCRS